MKTVLQICLYILEIGVFCGGATFASIMLFNTNNTITTIEIMERFAIFYGFYQLIVFLILTNLNDIWADEYLALKNTAELASLSLESQSTQLEQQVRSLVDKQLESDVFNDTVVRKSYQDIIVCLGQNNLVGIKQISIWASHCSELATLNGRFSFLLRIFKQGTTMSCFNIVTTTNENAVVTEYTSESTRSDAFQSEASPIENLSRQLKILNNYTFTDDEWKRFFTETLANEGIAEKSRIIQKHSAHR